MTDLTGTKVIVRCYASGVHYGTLAARDGREVALTGSRRLWRWHTGGHGISLSEVATTGIDAKKSQVAVALDRIVLLDALEVIPVTEAAAASIESAPVAKPS
jgi:hypothetical protein